MARMPSRVAAFLSGKRFAVAGVSRDPNQAANAIFRKLRGSGFEVFPVNPNASEVESERCYPNLASVPGVIDGVVIATHPRNALDIVRQCGESEVRRVWFHRAFGEGSVSPDAVHECSSRGIECIVGGCPLMYCEPVCRIVASAGCYGSAGACRDNLFIVNTWQGGPLATLCAFWIFCALQNVKEI